MNPIPELREIRQNSEVLEIAAKLFYQNFKLFGKILLLFLFPVVLLKTLVFSKGFLILLGADKEFSPGIYLLFLSVQYSLALEISALWVYCLAEKQPAEFQQLILRFRQHPFRFLRNAFVYPVILSVNFLLIVPGFYWIVALSLGWAVQVFENKGLFSTIKRCMTLTHGYWFQTATLLFTFSLSIGIAYGVVSIPQMISLALLSGHGMQAGFLTLVFDWMAGLGTGLLQLFAGVVTALQYLNLVERTEAPGLRKWISLIGKPVRFSQTEEETW